LLFLTESEVRLLLPMADTIRLMREAFEAWGRGEAQNQPRRRLILPTGSVLHSLAGAYGNYFGTKIYATHPKHGAHFLFMLYEAASARPLALMEANYLGQIRTGAASGYATDLLANPEASVLAIIGTGFQAATQLEAISAVRPIREVRVWSRSAEKRRSFALEHSVIASDSAESAVRGAHIVATATNAKDPVIEDSWIGPGVHINAMGSNIATRRELPGELVKRASVIVVDSLEQAKIEAGDLILADSWENVAELKNIRKGYEPGRITIFKSIGIGLEDVAAGGFVYEQAQRAGVGRPLYS
jgi:ornithine cyclodeaminase/alanine dehydrogenase-like protein (mu-crystallin family)